MVKEGKGFRQKAGKGLVTPWYCQKGSCPAGFRAGPRQSLCTCPHDKASQKIRGWSCLCPAAAKSLQSCPTLCHAIACSPPGSSVHGIFQVRILEWVAISSSKGSSQPRDGTHISYVSCLGKQVHKQHLVSLRLNSANIESFQRRQVL